MYLTILIDSVDRTDYVQWQSVQREDAINNQVDTFSFQTKCYGSKDWKPEAGSNIEVTDLLDGWDGTIKLFAGVIVTVEETIEADVLSYNVSCKDWTHYLDQKVVIERFENKTVNEIIATISANYLSGFTINSVDCGITIATIAFNRLPVSECLQILADRVNYYWYIDYDKDIHFFAKNSEGAPFDLTDTNGNYIPSSLVIKDDISQMKNIVFVSGAEFKGDNKTVNLVGDGTTKVFYLGYKFSNEPAVTIDSVEQDVGAEFLNNDEDHDCLWSYGQKYIRFVTAPTNGAVISATGTPLIPITVREEFTESVATYGEYEFSVVNKSLRSKDECRQYALSQLEAYGRKISEGSFQTYRWGLRSGQVVRINSTRRGIDEGFLIQRVGFQMRTPHEGLWQVELATMKTIGIITFLQNLLIKNDEQIEVAENEVLEKGYYDNQVVEITEEITKATPEQDYQTVSVKESIALGPMGVNVAPIFVLGPYFPAGHSDIKRAGRLGVSMRVY